MIGGKREPWHRQDGFHPNVGLSAHNLDDNADLAKRERAAPIWSGPPSLHITSSRQAHAPTRPMTGPATVELPRFGCAIATLATARITVWSLRKFTWSLLAISMDCRTP